MRDQKFLTSLCECCGGRIEFPAEGIGTTIACPHCANETELTLPPLNGESAVVPRARFWAIGGLIVLVALFAAAFYALHRAKQMRARAKHTLANSVSPSAKPMANSAHLSAQATVPPDWIITNDFAVSPVGLTLQPGSLEMFATGIVRNLSPQRRFAVRIELDLLDEAGASIGHARDYRSMMEPNAEWPFEAQAATTRPAAARLRSVRDEP